MCLQNKKTNGHWRVSFLQHGMITTEHFGKLNYIVIALAHFSAVNGNHIIMNPIAGRRYVVADRALCDFTFVVRKQKVHAATVYIELLTQVFCTHCRALNMPSRES